MPIALPVCLFDVFTATLVIHAILFYYYLYKAMQCLQRLQPDCLDSDKAKLKNGLWYYIGELSGQGNLMVVAQVSHELVLKYLTELSKYDRRGPEVFEDVLGHMHWGPLMGPARCFFRIFMTAEVLAWLKISVLADGYEYLNLEERNHLIVAILVGLLSIAISFPDYIIQLNSEYKYRKICGGGAYTNMKLDDLRPNKHKQKPHAQR